MTRVKTCHINGTGILYTFNYIINISETSADFLAGLMSQKIIYGYY